MKFLIPVLLVGLSACTFESEPTDSQSALDSATTLVPESYTPTDGEETAYTGAVTVFPGGSVAFPIPAGVQSIMPWYSGNPNVKDGDVYFNVGDNRHAFVEFNLSRAPLWLPVPSNCVRAFMRNDSSETITVGAVYSLEDKN